MSQPQTSQAAQQQHDLYDPEGPGLVDALAFLYRKRSNLLLWFALFLGVGFVIFLVSYLGSPKTASGIVALTFTGVEKQEYPSGKKFSVEDFRSPDLLAKAAADAGLSKETSLENLAAHIFVTPVIPPDLQSRWKKQDRDGVKREDFSPNEFKLDIAVSGVTDPQRLRLFDAVIKQYRARVKSDEESAVGYIASEDISYDKLALSYDFWDLPALYNDDYRLLTKRIDTLLTETLQHEDPKYQNAFREVARDLETWHATRLMALEALTYQGKLVKNKDLMAQRIEYHVADLDIQIQQKSREANEAMRLLGILDRPLAVVKGQPAGKEGPPVVDEGLLEKLIKNDYVAPVVERVSKLQEEIQGMEAEKERLKRQLTWLPAARNMVVAEMPPGHRELVVALASELKSIIQKYNGLLDEFLAASVISKVAVTHTALITRMAYSPLPIVVGIVLFSGFLALVVIAVQHLVEQARMREAKIGTG